MTTSRNIFILNESDTNANATQDVKVDALDKNIKILITKLKASHMNEGI